MAKIQNSIKGLKDKIDEISPKVEQKERERESTRQRKADNGKENENIKVSVQEVGHLTIRNSRKVQRKWRG